MKLGEFLLRVCFVGFLVVSAWMTQRKMHATPMVPWMDRMPQYNFPHIPTDYRLGPLHPATNRSTIGTLPDFS